MKKNIKSAKAYLKPNLKKPAILNKVKLPTSSKRTTAKRRQDLKLHQHLLERFKTKKEIRQRKRAEYLATLPKGRVKKILYLLHPKRVIRYIFSREGLLMGLRVLGIGVLLTVVASFVVFAYFRKDLPKNITNLKSCSQGQKTSYFDRSQEVILWRGEGDVDCQPVPLSEISDFLQKAVIASEDQKFYTHPGFDVKGTLRATVNNLKGDNSQQGGSTLTQQYVKQAVLSDNEKKISRKIKELILSIELERTYKKDEILQAYLNEVPLGSVYNGAEAASQGFFSKSAKDLTLDEAAILAAAIQAPGNYWDNDQEGLVWRKDNYVLDSMVREGYVTKEQAEAAKKVDTLAKVNKSRNKYKDIKAPHFVLEVQRQLEDELGTTALRKQGYKVITTLDMTKQQFAEEAVTNGMAKVESFGFDNAALVSEDVKTGQVVAYVGSRDFAYPGFGQKNIASTPRSPGSSVKPYDYANLMKESQNWGAGSILYDWKTVLPGWGVNPRDQLTDYGNSPGNGPATMRYSLGNSKNIPAVKSVIIAGKGDGVAGITSVHRLQEKMGIKSGWTNCGIECDQTIATSIGDGGEIRLDENVHGMSTFARGGKVIPQIYVLKILDSKGKVIRDYTKEPIAEDVLDPQIAYIINDMLSDGDASYFRSRSRAARELAGFQDHTIPTAIKTGTTNNAENGLMMGYTPDYSTGVWTGHHENTSAYIEGMHFITGPIWGEYMRRVYESTPVPAPWTKPEGIKTVTHDSAFYSLVKGACGGDRMCNYGPTDIYPSWYTLKKSSNAEQKVVIDTVSGKRATSCTPEAARKELTGGGLIVPELNPGEPYYKEFMTPITEKLKAATGGIAIPAENELDTIHSCDDVKPAATISPITTCSSICTVTAVLNKGTHDLTHVYFKLDGAVMAGGAFDVAGNATSQSFVIEPDFSGAHELSVQVTDSALYDTTASTTITFTAIPFVQDAIAPSAGNHVRFTWDNISAADYTINYSGPTSGSFSASTATCSAGTGSKCTFDKPKAFFSLHGTYTFTIESSGPGRQTNSKTFAL